RFSLRFDQSGSRFILEEWRPTTVRQRLRIHPPSQNFTSVYLTYSLRNSLLNTLIFKGCHRLFKWAMHAGFFVSTWGGKVSLISHLTPQVSPRVYSPRNCQHDSSIQIKVTIITRYNIIELLTMAYSYDLCRSLQYQQQSQVYLLMYTNVRSVHSTYHVCEKASQKVCVCVCVFCLGLVIIVSVI